MKSARGVLVVFAKAPRPGCVKTRMSPPLSPEQAATLYAHLLDDVLETTAAFCAALALEPVLTVHPADALRELAVRAPPTFRLTAQRGRDLGERMTFAALEAAASGATRILLRGSDTPVLGEALVARMLDELESTELVISPDAAPEPPEPPPSTASGRGGGYGLIGMRRPVAGLFAHAMSTPSVLEDTVANATALGLETKTIDPCFDIDTAADLLLLAEARARGEATRCPRLLGYLDENALWPDRSR